MALNSQHGQQCQAGPALRKSWAGPQHPLPWLQGPLCPQQGPDTSQITRLDGILPVPARASVSLGREAQGFTASASKIWRKTTRSKGLRTFSARQSRHDPQAFPNHLRTNSAHCFSPCLVPLVGGAAVTSMAATGTELHLPPLANSGEGAKPPKSHHPRLDSTATLHSGTRSGSKH